MTFTINVPVFPMRQEIEMRRLKISSAFRTPPRPRSRDAQGFLELEMLPLDQIDSVESVRARRPQR